MPPATAPAALPTNPDPPQGPRVEQAGDTAPAYGENIPTITHTEPAHAQSASAQSLTFPVQSHAARVLSLLRKLIAYGQDLARTVQERTAAGALLTITLHFGTRDFALILARITRGLRLANALEAKLLSSSARPSGDPAPARAPADRAQRPAGPRAKRPALPDVPTAEEIAAALRGRPAAAVIADICRDLGIAPGHPLWNEVMWVVAEAGGGFIKLLKDTMARVFGCPATSGADQAPGWAVAAPHPHPVAALGTGPP